MGGAQGGLARSGPRVNPTPTTLQLRLKIALVFDAVFLRFWLHLGSQDGLENRPKSLKNRLRKQFRSIFEWMFIDFSFDFGPPGSSKT